MKSIRYVSTVTNFVTRRLCRCYLEDPEKFEAIQTGLGQMWKVAQRELATGFYYGTPTENEQLFGARRKNSWIQVCRWNWLRTMMRLQTATIRQRNVINEAIRRVYGPGFTSFWGLYRRPSWCQEMSDRAPNQWTPAIKVPQPVQAGDMVRSQEVLSISKRRRWNQRHSSCLEKEKWMNQLGLLVDDESEMCVHYHGEKDIVSLQCYECKYYACYQCHNTMEAHVFLPIMALWDHWSGVVRGQWLSKNTMLLQCTINQVVTTLFYCFKIKWIWSKFLTWIFNCFRK